MKFYKYLLSLLLFPMTLMACSTSTSQRVYNISSYTSTLTFEDGFLICHLGDIHLSTSSNLDREFEYIEKAVYSYATVNNINVQLAKPSLLVLNGDIFMNANKEIVTRAFEFFESLEIPYAFNYGNHDLQGSYSSGYINNLLTSGDYQYSLYKNPSNDNVYGNSNYVINLMSSGSLAFQIIILDTNSHYLGDYDTIHDDQLSWYTRVILESNGYSSMPSTISDDTFKKSIVFGHIPIPEFEDAINYYHDLAGDSISYLDNYCNDQEGVYSSSDNSGFYDLMASLKSTVAIASNHDHINSTDIFYQKSEDYNPIRFIYGEKTTSNLYYDEDTIGATFYSIHENPTISDYGNTMYFELTKIHVPYEGDCTILWQNG